MRDASAPTCHILTPLATRRQAAQREEAERKKREVS